ncbi:hypothetical protein, partial [Escherichia coli]|uniref:hypothetical protein n=1 Tax=Escherichia coli TaxID=562 RepID=UPI00228348FB
RGEDLGDLQAWQRRLHDLAGCGGGAGRGNGGHGGDFLMGHVAGGLPWPVTKTAEHGSALQLQPVGCGPAGNASRRAWPGATRGAGVLW